MTLALTTRSIRLPLLALWLELAVLATSQSASGSDAAEPASRPFPEDGHVQFATGSSPPPPFLEPSDPYDSSSGASRAPNGLEILVAIFFFVAAAWLLVAVFYALLALLVLRLRARGRLDLQNEEFGRFYICGTSLFFPFGCILRRYVIAFGHDQPSSRRGRSADNISRSERRRAVEEILFGNGKLKSGSGMGRPHTDIDEEMGSSSLNSQTSDSSNEDKKASEVGETSSSPTSDHSHSQTSEESVCCICLAEYNTGENVFYSDVCDHMYHAKCILDWLERRTNTDCPCCRQPLVSEEAVMEEVRAARRLKQKQVKSEKRKGRVWRLVPLHSEIVGPSERETSASDLPSEGQDTMFTLPSSSRRDIMATDSDSAGADHSLADQSFTSDQQDEEAPPTTTVESCAVAPLRERTTSSIEVSPTELPIKGGSRGGTDEERRDPPCEPDSETAKRHES